MADFDNFDDLYNFIQKMKQNGLPSSTIPPVIKPVSSSDLRGVSNKDLNDAFDFFHKQKTESGWMNPRTPVDESGQLSFNLRGTSPQYQTSKTTDQLVQDFTPDPQLVKEAAQAEEAAAKKVAEEAAKKAAQEAAKDSARAEQIASSAKPIYGNSLEEAISKLNALPSRAKEKLSGMFKGVSEVGGKWLPVVGSALAATDALKTGNELGRDYNDLNWQEKLGKSAKLLGDSAAAVSGPMAVYGAPLALETAGISELPAAITGLGGAGLSMLGGYLDEYGRSLHPAPPPAIKKAEEEDGYKHLTWDGPTEAPTIDVMDKLPKDYNPIPAKEEDQTPKTEIPKTSVPKDYISPSKKEVLDEIKKVALEKGQDPSVLAAKIDQESSFNPLVISQTGAKGLGQMFPDAWTNAKQMDNQLTGEYHDLTDPRNWRTQIRAAAAYDDWIKKSWKPKSLDEQLRMYNAGPGNDKDPTKGFNGSDAKEYSKTIQKKQNKYKFLNEPEEQETTSTDTTLRGPASITPTEELTPEQIDAQRRVLNYLKRTDDKPLGDANAPLMYGPVTDIKKYGKFMDDANKLTAMKKQYDEAMSQKSAPPTGSVPAASGVAPKSVETGEPESEGGEEGGETKTKLSKPFQRMSLDELMDFVQKRQKNPLDLEAFKKDMKSQGDMRGLMRAIDTLSKGVGGAIARGIYIPKDTSLEQQKLDEEDITNKMKLGLSEYEQQENRNTRMFDALAKLQELQEKAESNELYRQQRLDEKKEAEDLKQQNLLNKNFRHIADIIQKPDVAGRMSNVSANQTTFNRGLHVMQLFKNAPNGNLNNLTGQDMYEVAKSLDQMYNQGGSTVSGTDKLMFKPYIGDLYNLAAKIGGRPIGVHAKEYFERAMTGVDRQMKVSNKIVKDFYDDVKAGIPEDEYNHPKMKPQYDRLIQRYLDKAERIGEGIALNPVIQLTKKMVPGSKFEYQGKNYLVTEDGMGAREI